MHNGLEMNEHIAKPDSDGGASRDNEQPPAGMRSASPAGHAGQGARAAEVGAHQVGGEAGLTHVDASGNAQMVAITRKRATARRAVAEGYCCMSECAAEAVRRCDIAKGDVLQVARLAGIMAAKRTDELIPLCHGLALTAVDVNFAWTAVDRLQIRVSVETVGATGVEMEALTAVSVAALTVYDMCKAIDKQIRLEGIRLLEKSGGASGDYRATSP